MKVDIDGYFFFRSTDDEFFLMIAEEDYDIVFDYIREKEIKNIMLSETGGCSGDDLDFLADGHQFEKIWIFFKKPVDLGKLYHQTALKELHVSDAAFNIDYNRFPLLENLSLIGQKQEIGPFAAGNRLKHLSINEFCNTDLSFLQACKHLETLTLIRNSRLTSLAGLEGAANTLEGLELNSLPNLTVIESLRQLTVLKRLFIEKCWSLNDISIVEQVQTLTLLSILDCSTLISLRFIDQLPVIQEVYLLGTKISDGYQPDIIGRSIS